MPTRLHLDTDIGGDIDDMCALALALGAPDVEVTGVTTVLEAAGERAGYAREALAIAGRPEVPVAAGAHQALGRFRDTEYGLPPEDRYWPRPVAPAPGRIEAALDLLARSIEAGATVVAIGPVTNLALLEERAPGTLRGADLVLMGGHIAPPPEGYPDWGFDFDFNLQADVEAARAVLEAADRDRLTLVPIETTVQAALRREHLPALRRGGPLARLLARQAEAFAERTAFAQRYAARHPALPSDLVNFQHDPLAVAVALGWPGVTIEALPLAVTVEDGWLRFRPDPTGCPYRVATAVDRDAFATYWLDAVTRT
ncbi:MAG: nucleoside hydrolase [Dehalococcoidia bacterium]